MILPILALFNNEPDYTSTSDVTAQFSMIYIMCIAPLINIGSFGLITLPKK